MSAWKYDVFGKRNCHYRNHQNRSQTETKLNDCIYNEKGKRILLINPSMQLRGEIISLKMTALNQYLLTTANDGENFLHGQLYNVSANVCLQTKPEIGKNSQFCSICIKQNTSRMMLES